MCGIFGFLLSSRQVQKPMYVKSIVDVLFALSETRGKEAAGLAAFTDKHVFLYKEPVSASRFKKTVTYRALFNEISRVSGESLCLIGHSRLVTNGGKELYENNQPVVKEDLVCVHNGIVVNDREIWSKYPKIKKEFDVDTEVILSLTSLWMQEGNSFVESVKFAFGQLQGAASVAVLSPSLDQLVIATNNGSLYIAGSQDSHYFLFASEKRILEQLFSKHKIRNILGNEIILQVCAGFGYVVDLNSFSQNLFALFGSEKQPKSSAQRIRRAIKVFPSEYRRQEEISFPNTQVDSLEAESILNDEYKSNSRMVSCLKRCAKCVLPETFPFISFDEKGVCNYCHSYKKLQYEGQTALDLTLKKYRRSDGAPDCIIAISGGRDSCYGLHYFKKVLGMHPLAYTYDWGMITDLARRNISRMCGALGVEHLLISADIGKKREYIRKNVLAWLKKPDLGTVPLFMAGDKQYFNFANQLQKQYKIKLLIMCENRLERTHFKHGFCGVEYRDEHKPAYQLSILDNIKLVSYYARQYIANPAYLNSSLRDALSGYVSFYLIPHNYSYLYNYIVWDEKQIINTLRQKYNWEICHDTDSTWRIGDGTAPFYNYIYYTIAGFSENDTFRSNQIREGLISRQEAILCLERENRPCQVQLSWYCDTIGIKLIDTLKVINGVPKLYLV